MKTFCLFILLFLAGGCTPEVFYDGRPLEYWKRELKSKDAPARWRAASVFADIGTKAKMARPELIDCLRDNQFRVVELAAAALGNLGPDAKEAVPELLQCLKHPVPRVRDAAEAALKKIDPDAAAQAGIK